MENYAGIPILQQHGSDDENVPAYHSRRLNQLSFEAGQDNTYVELPGRGHWFDGVMTTKSLCEFYRSIPWRTKEMPVPPESFSIIVPSSGNMGPRGGIFVDQLMTPDQLGKILVDRREPFWSLKTSNIRRFHFTPVDYRRTVPDLIMVDGVLFTTVSCAGWAESCWFIRSSGGPWTVGLPHIVQYHN